MRTYKIGEKFTMSEEEIKDYSLLPDNLPGSGLTAAQIKLINNLYYKYITCTIDRQGYNKPLYEAELKEKWPSGPRVKEHEAKRFVLDQLIEVNQDKRKEMTADVAAEYFLACMHWKDLCQSVIKAAYAG